MYKFENEAVVNWEMDRQNDQEEDSVGKDSEFEKPSILAPYYTGKNALSWWTATSFICCVFVVGASFGVYFLTDSDSTELQRVSKDSEHGTRKIMQVVATSFSVAASGLVAIGVFKSKMFRAFAFPGVAPLCVCQLFIGVLRLIQLVTNFSILYYEYCVHVFFLAHFFLPASNLWLSAIVFNLHMSLTSTNLNQQKTNAARRKGIHLFIWLYSVVNACIITDPYRRKVEFFSKEATSGICRGTYGVLYSYMMLPCLSVLVAGVSTYSFCVKIKMLYPKRTTRMIKMRTNLYFFTYAITWCLLITLYGLSKIFVEYFDTFLVVGYTLYDLQGFMFSMITIREFAYHSNRADLGLHLQSIDIREVDFGHTTNTLGEGTYAVVFQATWRNQKVAVKVFKMKELNHEQVKHEAYLASKLRHPNVVLTYGCSLVDNNSIAIITECMSGGTLDDIIFGKRISYDQVLHLGSMIANGMCFLHTRSTPIVHRDLKPSNCLVDHQGTIKIADFGCSRWLREDTNNRVTVLTARPEANRLMTSNVGTPCWTVYFI